jgi:methylenetetrahydrofolate reductase (NADPH)
MARLPGTSLELLRALHFAAQKHRDQRRKDSEASPYINHPIELAETLARVGGIRDLAVLEAALLHDTVEDTETSAAELEAQFGPEVRALVAELTDDKRLPKPERKRLQVEHAPSLSQRAKLVKLADNICNLRDIAHAPPRGWSQARRAEYLAWTERVVSGLRGENAALERRYDEVLREARQVLSSELPERSQISIELVPRSAESLDADLRLLRERFPRISTVNVPDLLRFPVRSWDACQRARRSVERAIAHLRSMDFDLTGPFVLKDLLATRGLSEVLVVRGDTPQALGRRIYPTRPTELIAAIKSQLPGLKVYASFDPYSSTLHAAAALARAKLDAGADGFFTQPFFDLRWMDVCAEVLAGCEVYWGVSPVLGPQPRRYWEVKNRVVFPAGFEPTLAWNHRFAAASLAWVRERGAHIYFMPIRTDLGTYLEGIL